MRRGKLKSKLFRKLSFRNVVCNTSRITSQSTQHHKKTMGQVLDLLKQTKINHVEDDGNEDEEDANYAPSNAEVPQLSEVSEDEEIPKPVKPPELAKPAEPVVHVVEESDNEGPWTKVKKKAGKKGAPNKPNNASKPHPPIKQDIEVKTHQKNTDIKNKTKVKKNEVVETNPIDKIRLNKRVSRAMQLRSGANNNERSSDNQITKKQKAPKNKPTATPKPKHTVVNKVQSPPATRISSDVQQSNEKGKLPLQGKKKNKFKADEPQPESSAPSTSRSDELEESNVETKTGAFQKKKKLMRIKPHQREEKEKLELEAQGVIQEPKRLRVRPKKALISGDGKRNTFLLKAKKHDKKMRINDEQESQDSEHKEN